MAIVLESPSESSTKQPRPVWLDADDITDIFADTFAGDFSVADPMPAQRARRTRPEGRALARRMPQALRRLIAGQPLWRNHTYLTMWGGRLVSATGSQMSQLAFPLLVLLLTHSAAVAGLAGALRMLPYLVLTLPAGALVDRWDRRRVMLTCDAFRALALGSIPLALALGRLSVFQVFAVALVEGSLFVFFDLAETASLPVIVSEAEMPAATAQYLGLTDGITTLLGPALGGALFAAGRMIPFLLDAISYGVSVVALSRIRFPRQATTSQPAQPASAREHVRSIRRDIVEGITWLWRQPALKALTLCLALSNVLFAGEALLVIVLAERLHATMGEVGLVLALGGGGTVVGSLVAERVVRRLSFLQAFVGSNWLVAGVWLLYALVPTPFALGLVMAGNGFIFAIINVAQFSYRMSLIPEALQGRISSIIRMLIYGAIPLGLAVTGPLIQRVGAVPTVLILGAGLLALATLVTLLRHALVARPAQLTSAPALAAMS